MSTIGTVERRISADKWLHSPPTQSTMWFHYTLLLFFASNVNQCVFEQQFESMMNNRRSVLGSDPLRQRLSQSPFNEQTHTKNSKPQNINSEVTLHSQIIFTALNAIMLSSPDPLISSIKVPIRQDQKTVLNILNIFLNSFQRRKKGEKIEVKVQEIPEIFRLFKYKHPVNKNLFNPVGARHTWPQCLTLLGWMAKLVMEKHSGTDQYGTQGIIKQKVDVPFFKVMAQVFNNNDVDYDNPAIGEFLNERVAEIQKSTDDNRELEENITQAITAENNRQKDVTILQGELQKNRQIQFREAQEEAVEEQEIKEAEILLAQNKQELADIQAKVKQSREELMTQEETRRNQEYSVQQAESIEREILETETKILEKRDNNLRRKEEYQGSVQIQIKQRIGETKGKLLSKIHRLQSVLPSIHVISTLPQIEFNEEVIRGYMLDDAERSPVTLDKACSWNYVEVMLRLKDIAREVVTNKQLALEGLEAARKTRDHHQMMYEEVLSEKGRMKATIETLKMQSQGVEEDIARYGRKKRDLDLECEQLDVKIQSEYAAMNLGVTKFKEFSEEIETLEVGIETLNRKWDQKWEYLLRMGREARGKMDGQFQVYNEMLRNFLQGVKDKDAETERRFGKAQGAARRKEDHK